MHYYSRPCVHFKAVEDYYSRPCVHFKAVEDYYSRPCVHFKTVEDYYSHPCVHFKAVEAMISFIKENKKNLHISGVQFSSVQDGICALGKVHMLSTLSHRSFPSVAFETVPMFM